MGTLRRLLRTPFERLIRLGGQLGRAFHYRRRGWRADRSHDPLPDSLSKAPSAPDHIAIVVVDALRPDSRRLPNIELPTTTAIAPSTWTFPSVTSILTGQYPHEHGAVAHTDNSDDEFAIPAQVSRDDHLPNRLEAAGYDTFGCFSFGMPFLATKGWFNTHRVFSDANAEQLLTTYRKWRRNRDRTFAYIHLGDLHAPLRPPDTHVRKQGVDMPISDLEHIGTYNTDYIGTEEQEYYRSQKLALYRAGVDYVTSTLATTFDGLLDDTFLILTGDHGEALYEHAEVDRAFDDSRPNYGVGHGGTPLDQVARVPLAVSHPDLDLLPTGGWPTLCDVPATVTDTCLDTTPDGDGLSWGDSVPTERTVLCEGVRYGAERKAAYRGEQKLVRSCEAGTAYVATVAPDAEDEVISETVQDGEISSFAKAHNVGEMDSVLSNAYLQDSDTETTDVVDSQVEERLRNLGYQ